MGHQDSTCTEPCIQLGHAKTWPLTKMNLQHNDRAMIIQICRFKPEDVAAIRSSELVAKLELEDLTTADTIFKKGAPGDQV